MPKRNLAWILVVVVIALLLWQLPVFIAERDSIIRNFGTLNDIRVTIKHNYVSEPDDQKLVEAAVRAGAEAMIHALHDPHARYFDQGESIKFERQSEGLIGGIGADTSVIDGQLVIQLVMPGTAAEGVGLQRGDMIVAIDGRPVGNGGALLVREGILAPAARDGTLAPAVGAGDAAELLAGEPGSEVRIRVCRAEAPPREYVLTRCALQVNPVRGWSRRADGQWRYTIDPQRGIAYVRLSEFWRNAAAELDQAIQHTLQHGVRAWVLDLRENRGGLLDSAVEVADRFLSEGVIVSTRGRTSDKREWTAQRQGTYPDLPMVVLVNGMTASSAEIVAGALRDHRRAQIIGERTYGKGSVQELYNLPAGGAIKLTARYYYLPSGTCIQKPPGAEASGAAWGVEPNEVVALTAAQREAWLKRWLTATWDDEEERATATSPDGATNAASPSATQPAPSSEDETESPAEQHEAAMVRAMLDSDPQLVRGLEYLRARLSPPSATSRATIAADAARPH